MKKKFVVTLSAAMMMMMSVPVISLAAMAGANTVNSAAIVDGAVATVDIANKAVTAAKIADSTITATQLASGSVTDAKISGTISASKIQSGVFQNKYANVIVVAKSGGDFTDLIQALAAITDASESNPYLVKVMPGVYDLSTNLTIPSYVEIEGAGEIVTKIKGTVACNQNTAIRFLTVENMAGPGINANGGPDNNYVDLRNLTVRAKDVGIATYGKVFISSSKIEVSRLNGLDAKAILNQGQDVTISDVTAVALGTIGGTDAYAIYNFYAGKVVLNNVTAIASASPSVTNYAVYSIGSLEITINNSTLKALGSYNNYGVTNVYYGSQTVVSNSKIITEDPAGIGTSNIGIFSNDGAVRVDHTEIKASRSVLWAYGGEFYISYSRLVGGPMYSMEPNPAIGVKCIGNYSADNSPYVCP
jgi:hypothetical protein